MDSIQTETTEIDIIKQQIIRRGISQYHTPVAKGIEQRPYNFLRTGAIALLRGVDALIERMDPHPQNGCYTSDG